MKFANFTGCHVDNLKLLVFKRYLKKSSPEVAVKYFFLVLNTFEIYSQNKTKKSQFLDHLTEILRKKLEISAFWPNQSNQQLLSRLFKVERILIFGQI